MINQVQRFVQTTDSAVARVYLRLFGERSGILTFLFHALFQDADQIERNDIDPLERTTVAQFRQLVEYYVKSGFRFLTPADLLQGVGQDGKYVMLTFDDGYANNRLALPILEEFDVPAIFFISTNHVQQNKCYWWDVLYRERLAKGVSERDAYHEGVALKGLRTSGIEERLKALFGSDSFTPRGDVDRPFSPKELREFASHRLVHLGNHTADHAILTNYSLSEVKEQVEGAQHAIEEMTGVRAISIAYPNGGHNAAVCQACREVGLRVGFTVRPEKTRLPLQRASRDLMRLGRFMPTADGELTDQCQRYRSDVQLYRTFRDGYLWMARGQVGQ